MGLRKKLQTEVQGKWRAMTQGWGRRGEGKWISDGKGCRYKKMGGKGRGGMGAWDKGLKWKRDKVERGERTENVS